VSLPPFLILDNFASANPYVAQKHKKIFSIST
jgi:hypothetical protein